MATEEEIYEFWKRMYKFNNYSIDMEKIIDNEMSKEEKIIFKFIHVQEKRGKNIEKIKGHVKDIAEGKHSFVPEKEKIYFIKFHEDEKYRNWVLEKYGRKKREIEDAVDRSYQ